MPKSLLYASLSVGANEMKYLFNSFAIILRFIISSLFITKLGFNSLFCLPRTLLIICHTFLLSPSHSNIFPVLYFS